jgi:RND superfamily putative drug exporter
VDERDNRRAVRVGQLETARVITAAATIMICVFLAASGSPPRWRWTRPC